jgi:hypothetical protein
MEKCLDYTRFHYVEGDIESLFFALSGVANRGINQGFKNIISEEKFYNENVYKWLPNDFYSSDNFNLPFETNIEKMGFDKKLLGMLLKNNLNT